MRLEVDEITGDHIIRVPDDAIEDLDWDEGDEIGVSVSKTNDHDNVLVVYLK